ncbi:DUF1592 domain-containing protein [Verrucomicrobiales bacterium BCK34]|nr:DUF1592 domain-containing protein [Verrucomicrobiales bacterium BCK34]
MQHQVTCWLAVFGLIVSSPFSRALAEDEGKAGLEAEAEMPEIHFDVLDKYCLECHDSLTEKGEVNLEDLSFSLVKDIETAETWNKVLNAINSGEMPPGDELQISDEEKTAFLTDLSEKMVLARAILSDSGGEVALRRLNRREYANTVEELLGVRPDVSSLPDDQASAEFDTMGASLFFSSDQLELYLETASETLDVALTPSKKIPEGSRLTRIEPEEIYYPHYLKLASNLLDRAQRNYAWQLAGGTDELAKDYGYLDGWQAGRQLNSFAQYYPQVAKYLSAPENKTGAAMMITIKDGFTQIKLPQVMWNEGGKHTIRLRAGAYADDPDRYHYLEFTRRDGQNVERLGYRKVTGTLRKPEIIEFTIDHPPGKNLAYWVQKRSHEDRGDKNLWAVHREENGYGTPWGIWVDWAEIEKSSSEGLNPMAQEILFEKPEGMNIQEYYREVIQRFAQRAFRGADVEPEYLEKLYARFDAQRAEGKPPVAALIQPLAIILSSPNFLYFSEAVEGDDKTLSDRELAVRLSYFLWSSPPDARLMKLAREGELSNPEVLEAQTSRLLADSRSGNFVRGFVYQWLDMHRLGMFSFDGRQFPDFDNAVRDSAREEIYRTFEKVMHEKLPLKNLLKGDFVVVNDVLADYYRIEGVKGHEFRAVKLPGDSPRGGLLGTVAFAAMGSDGVRSSPVERGAWVLRHLLNNPPPPAPPNVPQLSRFEDEVLSARELQKFHQEQPQCAQCHQKIDPIGYGMENFDPSGQWREVETVITGRKRDSTKEFPIEPAGKLSDGTEFESYYDLREVVADRTGDYAMGLTEALTAYGLGRPFGFSDHELAHQIVEKASRSEFQIERLIHELVQSSTFQSR